VGARPKQSWAAPVAALPEGADVRVVKFVFSQALVVGLLSTADPAELGNSGLPVRSAFADESAESCVGFEKTDVEKGVEYSVKNSCDKKLSCQVSWKVSCENGEGKVTQSRADSSHFMLPGTDEHTVQASASDCKAGWRIDDVAWSCNDKR
jgi:hypothetical protein